MDFEAIRLIHLLRGGNWRLSQLFTYLHDQLHTGGGGRGGPEMPCGRRLQLLRERFGGGKRGVRGVFGRQAAWDRIAALLFEVLQAAGPRVAEAAAALPPKCFEPLASMWLLRDF